MDETPLKPKQRRFGFLSIAIIVLVVATAVIHLYLGVSMGSMGGPGGGPPQVQMQPSGTPPAGSQPQAGVQPSGTPQAGSQPQGGPSSGGPGGAPGSHGGGGLMSLIPVPLSTLFYLNFAGYIVLVVALYLPQLRRFQPIVRWVLIGYTALTVILWYLMTGGRLGFDDVSDKLIEVALIVLLVIEGWRNRLIKA